MVSYDRILVPTDGSDGTERVLDHAVGLATDHDAVLHGLHVVDRRLVTAADEEDRGEVRTELHERGETAVGRVERRADEAGLDHATAVREGVPDREIREYARDADVDVVVMGTHGRTGRDRLASLGSVAERVVSDTDLPVFVTPVGGESG